jgi:tetratricopeptide (TPR) repeat protein
MAPAPFITGLAVALFLAPGLAAAGPSLSGPFRAELYGPLELKTEGAHVVGTALPGNACRFDSQSKVLEGDFEGSVLVARLRVCQTGDLCPAEQTYTVLGFYNAAENSVVAYVKLSSGCQSAALPRSGRFMMVSTAQAVPAETPTSSTAGSATDLVTKRNPRMEAAKQASQRGEQLYKQNLFAEAVKQFKQSLDIDSGDTNWPAYLGRGSSLLKLGKVDLAIRDLERANSARRGDPSIFYMLGCAYAQKRDKPKALEYLGRAVEAGYDLETAASNDKDLIQAMGNDPKFKELVRSSASKKPRGTATSGNLSP